MSKRTATLRVDAARLRQQLPPATFEGTVMKTIASSFQRRPLSNGYLTGLVVLLAPWSLFAAEEPPPSSYAPVVIKEDFAAVMKRMSGEKAKVMQRQKDLLNTRYDLSDQP